VAGEQQGLLPNIQLYLRVRDEPIRGMVTSIHVHPGSVLYYVTWGDGESSPHYDIELSSEYMPEYDSD
jgi:hypothetical protein